MKVAGYICEHCSNACDFKEDDIREVYICPECGKPMWYLSSYEIDENTGLTIGESWYDSSREQKSPAPFSTPQPTTPTITCPTCGSTNTRKMGSIERGASILTFGIFSKKINKTFKCNNCGMTW